MAEIIADFDQVTKYVSEVFSIDGLTMGGAHQGYFARYQGMLKGDSEKAHAYLCNKLEPMQLEPLFRWEGDQQVISIMQAVPRSIKIRLWLNILLFILTFISVLFAGALFAIQVDPFTSPFNLRLILRFLWSGWPFAVSFIAIIAAHEFGHYLMGRHHKVNVSLPYFIPFPLSPVGTMGAFINMKSVPRNRKQLLDVAVAGPLAGLVVAIPVLFLGLALSKIESIPLEIPANMGYQLEGNSIFYLLSKYIVFGKWLPQPAEFSGLSPFVYWLRYFFTGRPLPLGGLDVTIHPVAWAGWVGLLITMLNLIPAGQFDGGHVFYVLFGQKASRIARPVLILILFVLGYFWSGWWLWAGLVFLMGAMHAEPLDLITPVDNKRRILAALILIIFLLIFMPVPLIFITGT